MPRRDVRLLNGLALLVLAVALAAVLLFADLGGGRDESAQPAPPTTQPALTTTSLPALTTTSTTIAGVVSTGQGPSAFTTTTTAPGPVQVIVEGAACVGFVGDGWRVRYRIVNRGPAATGPVVGRIDDGEPTVLEESRRLGRGDTHEATGVIRGGGDAIIVAWVTTPEGGTSSFPVETPGCPVDPADVREAGQVTPPSPSPEASRRYNPPDGPDRAARPGGAAAADAVAG